MAKLVRAIHRICSASLVVQEKLKVILQILFQNNEPNNYFEKVWELGSIPRPVTSHDTLFLFRFGVQSLPSFPIYILDLAGIDQVVHPEGRLDLNHSDFWKSNVAEIVAAHFGLPVKRLLNLPYCQRRARIVVRDDEAVVYYGERQTKKLLKAIAKSVGLPNLEWRFDEHEQRLEFDVAEFERMVGS